MIDKVQAKTEVRIAQDTDRRRVEREQTESEKVENERPPERRGSIVETEA